MTPQDAPYGCTNELLRYVYHHDRVGYCKTLILVSLAALTSQKEAFALATEDAPTVETAGEEMAVDLAARNLNQWSDHLELARAAALGILDVTGAD